MSIVQAVGEGYFKFQILVRDLVRKGWRVVAFLGFELEDAVEVEGGVAFERAYLVTGGKKIPISSRSFLKLRDHPQFPHCVLLSRKKTKDLKFVFWDGSVIEGKFGG